MQAVCRRRGSSFLAVAVMLFVASSATSPSGAVSDSRSRTFRSSAYRYSIRLPTDWSAIKADRVLKPGEPPYTSRGATDIITRKAATKVSKMKLPAVVIGAQRVPAGTTIDQWTAEVIAGVSEQKGCEQPASREPLRIGGDEAALLGYPDCPHGSGLYHLWTVVVHRGRGFQLVWFNNAGQEARDRAILDGMLSSLVFRR
jgi:hypothetical protein